MGVRLRLAVVMREEDKVVVMWLMVVVLRWLW